MEYPISDFFEKTLPYIIESPPYIARTLFFGTFLAKNGPFSFEGSLEKADG